MSSENKSGKVGLWLMTLTILFVGINPINVDLFGDTHVFNPDWTPHSRMHLVWLLSTNLFLSLLAVHCLWFFKGSRELGISIAGLIGVFIYGGFFVSASTVSLYHGALADLGHGNEIMGVNANLLVFAVMTMILLCGWYLARPRSA